MDKLWQWLMRANARGVFVIALVALLLATGWWVREEIRARDEPLTREPGHPVTPTVKAPVRLTVLDEVQRQLGFDPSWVPDTPFRPAVGDRRRRPDEPRTQVADAGDEPDRGRGRPRIFGPRTADADDDVDDEPVDLLPGDDPRRPVVRPRTPGAGDAPLQLVTLVYRGLFTRPDGTQVALIEDAGRGRRRFHAIGAELYGLQLESVDTRGIRIMTAAGDPLDLPLGQAMHFSEGMPLE